MLGSEVETRALRPGEPRPAWAGGESGALLRIEAGSAARRDSSPAGREGRPAAPPAEGLPLGVYVHIPFCVRKCHYCDFASGPAPEAIRERYVEALVREIRATPWRGHPVRTVFFGGGTPSELRTPQLERIVGALRETFRFVPADGPWSPVPEPEGEGRLASPAPLDVPEWTIECNPGTVSPESLAAMVAMGFQRISLGVQSFHDHHLKAIGRIHTAEEAVEAVRRARRAGFRRLNLDLIFCLPGQTLAEWRRDVEQALALEPEHLSLYNLTIEEKTEFGRRYRMGLLALPDEDLSAEMYEWALDRTAAAGFRQYEVSNFARPGEACRHNRIYWRQEPFLGFGLSAASYWAGLRWTNTASMQRYLATAGREKGPERASEERLPPREACGEAIMLALRTAEGAEIEALAGRYGLDAEREYGGTLRRLEEDGLLRREGDRWRLTRRGLLLANAVCAEFL